MLSHYPGTIYCYREPQCSPSHGRSYQKLFSSSVVISNLRRASRDHLAFEFLPPLAWRKTTLPHHCASHIFAFLKAWTPWQAQTLRDSPHSTPRPTCSCGGVFQNVHENVEVSFLWGILNSVESLCVWGLHLHISGLKIKLGKVFPLKDLHLYVYKVR